MREYRTADDCGCRVMVYADVAFVDIERCEEHLSSPPLKDALATVEDLGEQVERLTSMIEMLKGGANFLRASLMGIAMVDGATRDFPLVANGAREACAEYDRLRKEWDAAHPRGDEGIVL